MFYLDTQTNTRYYLGRAFNYPSDGEDLVQYGSGYATDAKFTELGFTKVVLEQRPDDRFYIVTGPDNTGSYTATARDLDDLKTEYKLQTKQTAFQMISGTDWYVIRLLELGTTTASVPGEISTYRAAVRTASDARCAEIDACNDVAALEALIKAPAQILTDPEDFDSDLVENPAAMTQFPEAPETGVYY